MEAHGQQPRQGWRFRRTRSLDLLRGQSYHEHRGPLRRGRLNFIVVSVKLSDAPQVIFLIAVTVGDGIPGKTPEAGSR